MTTFQTKLDVALLLESAAWPALLVDPAGIIRRANKPALELFSPGLEGQSIASILSEAPADPEKLLAKYEGAPAASVTVGFKTKDGSAAMIPASICAFTRENEKRFLLQLHGYGKSDTARIAKPEPAPAAAPLPPAPAAAKQKVDRAAQLARSVALDLNNALTSIMGHCSWILSHMEPDHQWRKSMEEINRAAAKSAEIAENLAAFSRSDKEREATISTNVHVVLKRIQQDLAILKDRKVHWVAEFEEQLYAARMDENKLQQVFTRVIENAAQSGALVPQITVQTRNSDIEATLQDANVRVAPGCYVCIEIIDNGRGIPTEILPRVFEPFFSTKPGHKGLGLAWAYGAVTNAGGGIAISSGTNQGTSVRLYIPAHKRVSRETAFLATRPDAGAGKTILLVDDEDLVLGVGRTVLSASGYKVLTALSGEKAIEVLADHKGEIDLVIVDWVMPRFSGQQLMDMIRAEYPSIAVLCTSGYAHVPGTGHTDFLQKPFTTQKLLERVKDKLSSPSAAAA
ncbi:MAG TPA: ATP-binding protein [Verrucomicrobiae bacterium]|nr:ATP-binding protein [Verrucomicrobiae bacterium]